MSKAVSALLIAVGVLATSSALAQQRGPATDGARGGDRPAMLTTEDRAALVDARIAALRTGLRLTPEQEKNWPAVESAIRDLAGQRGQVRQRLREARESRDPIVRLRTASDIMAERAGGLKRLADASEPLYRSLDDGQKRRLNLLTRQAIGPQYGRRGR
jgi:zinc resistance-associated protein